MTNDQLDRAINFILDQQAKTDAIVQGLGYKNIDTEAILQRLADKHTDIDSIFQQTAIKRAETEAILHQIAVRQAEAEVRQSVAEARHTEAEARIDAKFEQISRDIAILIADAVTTDHELGDFGDRIYSLLQTTEAQTQAINRLIDLSDRGIARHEQTEKTITQLTEQIDQLKDLIEKQHKAGRNGDLSN